MLARHTQVLSRGLIVFAAVGLMAAKKPAAPKVAHPAPAAQGGGPADVPVEFFVRGAGKVEIEGTRTTQMGTPTPAHLTCDSTSPGDCKISLKKDEDVRLTATPTAPMKFRMWQGLAACKTATCTFKPTGNTTVVAIFTP